MKKKVLFSILICIIVSAYSIIIFAHCPLSWNVKKEILNALFIATNIGVVSRGNPHKFLHFSEEYRIRIIQQYNSEIIISCRDQTCDIVVYYKNTPFWIRFLTDVIMIPDEIVFLPPNAVIEYDD